MFTFLEWCKPESETDFEPNNIILLISVGEVILKDRDKYTELFYKNDQIGGLGS